MDNNRTIQVVCAALIIVCLAVSGFLVQPQVNKLCDEQLIGFRDVQGKTMPPQIALTNMLGPFRGIALDALWYRSTELQQIGQYFEANQLAGWITTLQPRFPGVWHFLAWNMAFNISVETHTPEERWYWINNGIKLLRDDAIRYNPHSTLLYKELGWFYFMKISKFSDNYHWYYKARLAEEWQLLLGKPTVGATAREIYDSFTPIAEAVYDPNPVTAEKMLVKKYPGTAEILARLDQWGMDRNVELLKQLGRIIMFNESEGAQMLGLKIEDIDQHVDDRLLQLVNDKQLAEPFKHFHAYLQHRVLRQNYNMDPLLMHQLMMPLTAEDVDRIFNSTDQVDLKDKLRIGPLDWRNSGAHAAYWAVEGVRKTREMADAKFGMKNIDMLNTYRGGVHAIQFLKRYGIIYFDSLGQQMDMLPDPRFIPAYELLWKTAKSDISSGRYGVFNDNPYGPGHENFLLDATMESYLYGDEQQARFYYNRAKSLFGVNGQYQYNKTLADFVFERLSQDTDQMAQARQFITAMFERGLADGLANGRIDVFNRHKDLAAMMHEKYQSQRTFHNRELDARQRLQLEPLDVLMTNDYIQFMRAPRYSIMVKARVWANSPLTLRLKCYDQVIRQLENQCAKLNIDPARAFPQPEGLAAYREKHGSSPVELEQPTTPSAPVDVMRQ